jgi:hypothetical protein
MPFTYFAHQAPVLSLARSGRWHVDGVALAIGSMAPDFAYAILGTRIEVDAHTFPAVFTFSVPVALVVSWLVVRVLAPVVPPHLPDGYDFHLRDYRGLGTHRFRWGWAALWAGFGALTHVLLDEFTHAWGWLPRHAAWYRARILPGKWLGRDWTAFRVAQYIGHIGFSTLALVLLVRYGRQRWLADRARRVPPSPVTVATHAILWGTTLAGGAAGSVWAFHERHGYGSSLMRLSAGLFAGMVLGSLAVTATTPRLRVVQAARTANTTVFDR